MTVLPFPEWRPDVSDFRASSSITIQNVLPRADGYGPALDIQALTSALPSACRGYFFARNSDGTIAIFAGTATKLYKLSNTSFTWTDVSVGAGTYSGPASNRNWQFVQFNTLVFATQASDPLQVFTLGSSSAFSNALGSPPQADFIGVVNRFLVLTGISGEPYRVQWSGLNSPNASTSWDNATAQSNFQDLADGGRALTISGGDQYGIVFQEGAIRTMTFNPGSPEVFDFFALTKGEGLYAPYSVTLGAGSTYFLSTQGFKVIPPGGYPTPIGKEKFDRTFFADVDTANLQLVIAAADPQATRVYWAYKSSSSAGANFNKVIVYDYSLNRATVLLTSGQYLANLAKPGLTLELLDPIASGVLSITHAANNGGGAIRLTFSTEVASWTYGLADTTHAAGSAGSTNLNNGSQRTIEVYGVVGTTEANGNWQFTPVNSTHLDLIGSTFTNAYVSGGSVGGAIDSLTFSLDTISNATLVQLSAINTSGALAFYSGPALAATLWTAEQGDTMRRARIQGVRPITDAATVTAGVVYRETLQAAPLTSTPQGVNASGICRQNVSTRYARGLVSIPYGSTWTFASGVEPLMHLEGEQ